MQWVGVETAEEEKGERMRVKEGRNGRGERGDGDCKDEGEKENKSMGAKDGW